MGVTFESRGRVFRIDRSGPLDGVLPSRGFAVSDLERLLSDPARPLEALQLRDLLAELGLDPASLDEARLRETFVRLVRARRLQIEEISPPVARAPSPRTPGDGPDPEGPPGPVAPKEEIQKYRLVELVEYVDRGGDGTVGGAAGDSTELAKSCDRTEKEGAAFKQFINLKKDTDGAAARHPEQARFVDLRARIEWASGDATKSLAGKTVKWTLVEKTHAGSTRPGSLAVDAEKPGLGAADGTVAKLSSTDAKGWAKMRVHLSQYAGDEYTVEAQLDTTDALAIGGPAKKAGPFVVWRKFWYQLTKRDGSPVPAPATAVAAFTKLGADFVAADEVVFKKTDTPAPPDRTFYAKGMIEAGSADASEISVIGGHNRAWFWAKFNAETSRPVKGHLIICDAQWDPAGTSSLQSFAMTAKTQALTLTFSAWNSGVVKPALTGTVLTGSSWRITPAQKALFDAVAAGGVAPPGLPAAPARFSGALDDSHVSIPLPRASLGSITVTLPDDAPDPSAGYLVEVLLKVNFGKYYAGESVGVNMLIKHGAGGTEKSFSETVAHEYGHGFKQVPDKKNSASLPDHATQYDTADGHGGQGSHCSTGKTAEAVSASFPGGRFLDGTCIMFHQKTAACSGEFCATCQPHLRLQDMSELA